MCSAEIKPVVVIGLVYLVVVVVGPLITGVPWHPVRAETFSEPAGFGAGLLHGLLWPWNALLSLFRDGDSWELIYDTSANRSYPYGFAVGFAAWFLGKLFELVGLSSVTSEGP